MSLRFDKQAHFFINSWSTGNETKWFVLALILVFLYSTLTTIIYERYCKNNFFGFISIFFAAITMFILMTYNFWIILAILLGKTFGFFVFAFLRKTSLNQNFFD